MDLLPPLLSLALVVGVGLVGWLVAARRPGPPSLGTVPLAAVAAVLLFQLCWSVGQDKSFARELPWLLTWAALGTAAAVAAVALARRGSYRAAAVVLVVGTVVALDVAVAVAGATRFDGPVPLHTAALWWPDTTFFLVSSLAPDVAYAETFSWRLADSLDTQPFPVTFASAFVVGWLLRACRPSPRLVPAAS